MEFLDLLGGKFTILNIFLLIVCLFIISSFIKNKILKTFISLIFSIIITLQISSLYILKTYINYSFIIHLNTRDILGMLNLYQKHVFVFIIVCIALTILFIYSNKILKKIFFFFKIKKLNQVVFQLSFIILSIIIMSFRGGLINESYKLASILNVTNTKNLEANLKKLGMSNYTFPDQIESIASDKNIIVISLESFERGYLSSKFSHLTPYLSCLKENEKWNYYNMHQNEGSKWTSGSLYTTLTGFPAFFGTHHNKIFQTSVNSKITSISEVLKKAGYDITYLVSDAKFSGTKDLLNTFKIDDIIDIKLLQKSMHDKDLFDQAKLFLDKKEKRKKPFLLYLSTLSTHNPNGIYDDRMEKYLPKQANNLKFMASAVDYMVQDFITYLTRKNMLSNTIIYIIPDHLKHGSSKMFDNTGKRGLFLLTNARDNKINISKKDTIVQIDLPKIILDGAQIKHNAKFLTEFIEGDKNQFIKDHITELTKINISATLRGKKQNIIIPKKSKKYKEYKKDTARFIAHAGGAIDGYRYTNSLEALNKNYDKGFRLFELDIRKTSDNKYVAVHEWSQWKK